MPADCDEDECDAQAIVICFECQFTTLCSDHEVICDDCDKSFCWNCIAECDECHKDICNDCKPKHDTNT